MGAGRAYIAGGRAKETRRGGDKEKKQRRFRKT
jgi:hypothetical protein